MKYTRAAALILIVVLSVGFGILFGTYGGPYTPEAGCDKTEMNDGYGPVWTADQDYTEVRIKAGTEVYVWSNVKAGEMLTVPTGKDISHVIWCLTTTTTTIMTTTTATDPSTTTTSTSSTTTTVTTVPTSTTLTTVTTLPTTTTTLTATTTTSLPTTTFPPSTTVPPTTPTNLPYTGDTTGVLLILTGLMTAAGLALIWYGRDRA